MLFNSLSFLFFFPITVVFYFLLPQRARWVHLLACSCVFYAAFIPGYLLVLAAVILIDYAAGLLIERSAGRARGAFLVLSLAANIGLLAVFKYFNFLNGDLRGLADFLHWRYPIRDLGLILPIGLSFHTFQSMAYTIEVYRGRQAAERHLGVYSLYVMFFPQLVAGPIERPQHLLPQFKEHHPFVADRVFSGLKTMLWGFVKKIVVADRISVIVDAVYGDPSHAGGGWIVMATWLFAIQIYCDFSGYSEIAIGAARVLGFELTTNFDRPYAAGSCAAFWRRWHISLSTWFRDYLYIPLGGSRVLPLRWAVNIMVVFLISGMWHGASWNFAVWGALHGSFLLLSRFTQPLRNRIAAVTGLARFPGLLQAWRLLVTFNLVSLAWVFFRAPTLGAALQLLRGIGRPHFWALAQFSAVADAAVTPMTLMVSIGLVLFLLWSEWTQSRSGPSPAPDQRAIWIRWPAYYALGLMILWIGVLGGKTFIYFTF